MIYRKNDGGIFGTGYNTTGGLYAIDKDGNETKLGDVGFGSIHCGGIIDRASEMINTKEASLTLSGKITPEGAALFESLSLEEPDGYKVSYIGNKGKKKVKYISIEEGKQLLGHLAAAQFILGRELKNSEKINITKEFLKGKGSKTL